jgi:hypothetical protein
VQKIGQTNSRLTNSTFFRDSGEAPLFDYSDEHLHRIEFVHIAGTILLLGGLLQLFPKLVSGDVFQFGIACIPQTAKSSLPGPGQPLSRSSQTAMN